MKMRFLPLILSLAASSAFAATSRPAWVSSEIYNFNHPYAAQASNELATKMSKMNSSAFYFYRGTAHIFFKDMTTLPASRHTSTATGYTWLSGDAHLANLGAIKDAGGTVVFDTNDFDESHLGQYVWDVRRMAVSMVLAGRENGISDSNIKTAVETFVGAYHDKLSSFSGNDGEKTFKLIKSNTTDVVDDTIDAAEGKSRANLLSKYTTVNGGLRGFLTNAELATVPYATYSGIVAAVGSYVNSIPSAKRYAASYYTVGDIRQKLGSGTGSLGRIRYFVLIQGPTTSTSDDVILEMKQEAASAVAIAAPGRFPAGAFGSEGERVTRSMKAQLIDADVLAGFAAMNGASWFLREKSPFQEDFDYTKLSSSSKLKTAATYVGQALARAHALADKDYDTNIVSYGIDKEIVTAASKSALKTEISTFAINYANQVNLDWQAFKSAYAVGTPLY